MAPGAGPAGDCGGALHHRAQSGAALGIRIALSIRRSQASPSPSVHDRWMGGMRAIVTRPTRLLFFGIQFKGPRCEGRYVCHPCARQESVTSAFEVLDLL